MNHVVLAIHLSQKFRVILVILAILLILTILTILMIHVIHVIHVIQMILNISDFLTSQMIQNYHVLLIFSLIQQNQLSLMIQNNLELFANLIVLKYLMLFVIQMISKIS